MKGAQTVFLNRFMRFMKNNRGNADLMKRITRYHIDGRRLAESSTGVLPDLDLLTPAIQVEVQLRRQQRNARQATLQAAHDLNHGQMRWNKLSMMRRLGFTCNILRSLPTLSELDCIDLHVYC